MLIKFCKEISEKAHGSHNFLVWVAGLSQTGCKHNWDVTTFTEIIYFLGREEWYSYLPHTSACQSSCPFSRPKQHGLFFALLRCCTPQVGRIPATKLHRQLLEPAWTFTLGKIVLPLMKFRNKYWFLAKLRSKIWRIAAIHLAHHKVPAHPAVPEGHSHREGVALKGPLGTHSTVGVTELNNFPTIRPTSDRPEVRDSR